MNFVMLVFTSFLIFFSVVVCHLVLLELTQRRIHPKKSMHAYITPTIWSDILSSICEHDLSLSYSRNLRIKILSVLYNDDLLISST